MDQRFEEFYRLNADKVYRYLCLRLKSREEAEDLTADVFLKALRAFKGGEPPAWLFKIARNTLIDHWRRVKPLLFSDFRDGDEALEIQDEGQDIHEAAHVQHQYESVVEAFSVLTPEQQEVIILRFVEELPYSQVAEVMGRAEDAVRAIQSRGIKKLRDICKKIE